MQGTIVIKIGGAVFAGSDTTIDDAVALQKRGVRLIIVHGGGNLVTEWLKKQGAATSFISGERVTDRAILEVATAILAGLVNKEIVAAIISAGGRAAGISGVDGGLIESSVKNPALVYAGKIVSVKPELLFTLLEAGYIPVVAPICRYADKRPDDKPLYLNVNGDPVAGALAAAVKADKLVYMTDVDGVRGEDGKTLPNISAAATGNLLAQGVIVGGMIPKVNACVAALEEVKAARIINGKVPHALLAEFEEGAGGTTITR